MPYSPFKTSEVTREVSCHPIIPMRVALLLIVIFPPASIWKMTRVGSEATGVTLALPSLSVSVPEPDPSNPRSSSDRPVTWQMSYVCANGITPVPSGTGFCVNVHDPKVMVPLSPGSLLGGQNEGGAITAKGKGC